MSRNDRICDLLATVNPDIIMIQEFWESCSKLKELYRQRLCAELGYTMRCLPRTNHWRKRDDGLAIFIKDKKFILQDYQEILFHDCGDRVAQLVLLAIRPPETMPDIPPQQFICVNTHLLFPHNTYSTKIRLREVTKIMGFVETYRQIELCSTICSRSDIRIPVIIGGDFNGSPRGSVFSLMQSQKYRSAIEEYSNSIKNSDFLTHDSHSDTISKPTVLSTVHIRDTISITNHNHNNLTSNTNNYLEKLHNMTSNKREKWSNWISHQNHLNANVPVDQIFYLNPSEQVRILN